VDGLTGLYVRSFFMLRLEEELRRSLRYGRKFALLVLDIDRFKTVNDTHGHQVGDDAIQVVAQAIKGSIRAGVDLPGRYGGDELVLMLPETDAAGARIVAERIRGTVANTPVPLPGGGSLNVTVSIGVAPFPEAGDSASQLFARGDQALYMATQAGRNCSRVFEG
jgi:diguanylate cyclase (GGDEF)-like protein